MSNYTKSTNFATKDNLTPGDPLKIVRGTEIDTEFNNIATAIATKTDNASAAVTGGTINDTTIGATTASTGAFTTISATGAITSTLATGTAPLVVASTTKVTNLNVDSLDGADWASPAALGSTTPAAVSATTLSASGNVTLSGGTANGVAYLNGSKVVTSGSALTFDGTSLGVAGTATNAVSVTSTATTTALKLDNTNANGWGSNLAIFTGGSAAGYFGTIGSLLGSTAQDLAIYATSSKGVRIYTNDNNERMRVTSAGDVGIGTSSPSQKLDVAGNITATAWLGRANGSAPSADCAIYRAADNTLGFSTASTERMRLDSSGNLGLGVTPSASNACTNIELPYGATLSARSNTAAPQFAMMSNAVGNWYAATYKINGFATQYTQQGNDGTHAWYTAPSGTAGNAITFTQAMTLDASGNLMVGTTTPTANCKLTVTGAGISIAGGRGSTFALAYPDWSIYNTSSGNALAFDNGTERARIDSSGNLLLGATSAHNFGIPSIQAGGSNANAIISVRRDTTSAADQILFYNPNGSVGSISTSGSSTTYGTSSDYRLKNTIAPMTGALAKVALLKPCTYKWNADGSDGQGFIAHELAEVVPQCVTGEKDAVNEDGNPQYQGIDTSFLVATLTAALQEAHGLIKNLETRISALEAK
jgi:hypothetical protein